jgi:exoribonuclease R
VPVPSKSINADDAPIDFREIRRELDVPAGYPADAVAEARRARPPVPARDATTIPFVTIDPPGAMDLDQAMHLERTEHGHRVHYAIADVAAFVGSGGALDAETHRRGQTLYSPDTRTPLHPTVMSEGSASLLPDADRPAVLWTIELDPAGEPTKVRVERALVRSVARLDYAGVQADRDAGRPHPSIEPLAEIGRLRRTAARRRHAIDLGIADAEVVPVGRAGESGTHPGGRWTLIRRAQLPVERDNAEISLLTGMCAATIMVAGRVGVLRTLPPPDRGQVAALRRSAQTLGVDWPDGMPPGDVIAGLDPSEPRAAAFLEDAIHLLRGAGYAAFHGSLPTLLDHGGVGAPYAHVTAPLRRLVDRYATETCLALHDGLPVPEWVLAGLDALPPIMGASTRKADELERACEEAVAAFLLSDRIGETFEGVVVQVDPARDRAVVLLDDPPIRARCPIGGLVEGSRARVRLDSVDPASHRIEITPVPEHGMLAP